MGVGGGIEEAAKGGGGGGGEGEKKEERKLVTEVEFCVFDCTADRPVFTGFLKTSFSLQPDCCSHLFGSVHVLQQKVHYGDRCNAPQRSLLKSRVSVSRVMRKGLPLSCKDY